MILKSEGPEHRALIAHTQNEQGDYHYLTDHLIAVARLARQNADVFGAGDLGYLCGLWHDLGKAHPDFQQYLFDAEREPDRYRRGPDHKAAGTCLTAQNPSLQILAFIIAGHHGGLPDKAGKLTWFLQEHCETERVTTALEQVNQHAIPLEAPESVGPPSFLTTIEGAELFIRMLFSCLVDADVIDTQRHFDGHSSADESEMPTIADLWTALESDQRTLIANASDTEVNRARSVIFQHCRESASQPMGAFRLTVPTGGGKTRSGLAFALRHAVIHDLRRVIVAVPFTTVTEQTADTYRAIFSHPHSVLEHHSAVDRPDNDGATAHEWAERAAENWDAPLVVTTTVQLLESLFANRTTRCRKLHNIAGSVIILDEIQSLPPGLIQPTLNVLQQLVDHYRVSVALSTATQPALDDRSGFPGLRDIREIVPEPERFFLDLQRVEYRRLETPVSWDEIATSLADLHQVLVIVNTRRDARTLFEKLADPNALHLSTLMCGTHRREALDEIRRRLATGEPCRVIATQLVEAGVDLDFPVVYRAIGPLDRIVQAAGRCNREGLLSTGKVVIFDPLDGSMPPREYETGTRTAQAMFQQNDDDLHDPGTYQRFFKRLYNSVSLDSRDVTSARRELHFPNVARRYRIIDQDTSPVLVSYQTNNSRDPVPELLEQLIHGTSDARKVWRQLQAYSVSLTRWQLDEANRQGLVTEVREGLWQTTPQAVYHQDLGLLLDEMDSGALVF